MPSWVKDYELLSGLAASLLVALIGLIVRRIVFLRSNQNKALPVSNTQPITITNVNNQGASPTAGALKTALERQQARILFIDDDKSFKVVKIIKNANWPCVSIKRDIKDLDSPEVRDIDVFFIDIQGVGKDLGFADEGLGLALAIKRKYPQKKVVIYSAQTTGERFHPALREADAMLAKNAEPYEFIALLEQLTGTS
jgi:DNA-binding NarL/FixJ family response regulator